MTIVGVNPKRGRKGKTFAQREAEKCAWRAKLREGKRPLYAVFMFDVRFLAELREYRPRMNKELEAMFATMGKLEKLGVIIEPLNGA